MSWGLLFLAAAGLQAQTAEIFRGQVQEIVRKTRLKIGPVRIYPVLKFSHLSWVSNIFGYSNTLAQMSDLVITPSPELKANIVFRNMLILSFTENPEYHFYLKNPGYRGFTNSYNAEARALLFNRAIISGRYENLTNRYLGYQELDRVIEYTNESYSAQMLSQSSRGTSLRIEARFSRLSYEDVLTESGQISPRLNREEKSGYTEFGYRIFSATHVFLRGTYSEYDFLRQESDWRTSRAIEVTAGLQFPGTSVIRGSFAMGFKKFIPKESGVKGFAGLIGNASLQFRLENFGVLQLGFNRNNNFSLTREFLYYFENSVNGRLTFRLAGSLYIRLGGQYGQYEYPEEAAEVSDPDGTSGSFRDDYIQLSGGFVIRFTPTFGIGLSYQTWLRDSRLFGGNYRGNLVTIDIVQSF